jgi:hypothetical protein
MNTKRNFKYRVFPLFLCLFFTCSAQQHTRVVKNIWLIIHGTFAKKASWHTAQGDFFKTLQERIGPNGSIYNFIWSGENSYKARTQAGVACKNFIKTIMEPGDRLHIVGHSHGGNVAILAAQELTKEKSPLTIHKLITLGTPVCTMHYIPDMQRISSVYNLFSYGDRIQPVIRMFKRTYPEHKNIYNIQIQCNGLCPSHTELRYPLIAKHLPELEHLTKDQKNPLLIHFFDKKKATVTLDSNRTKDLETDIIFTEQLLTCFSESRHVQKNLLSFPERLPLKSRVIRFGYWWRFNPQ